MNDTLQDNIEYIFDYQTKLSYDLPINKVQLFEIDLSSSILNDKNPNDAINNIQNVLSNGFRKLYVNITWDNQKNNWSVCHSNNNKNKSYDTNNNDYDDNYDNENDNKNNDEEINKNEDEVMICSNDYSVINVIKSIHKWINNSNDCNIVTLIFRINSLDGTNSEQKTSCINGYIEKLEILKRDILSEISDILYTTDMIEGYYQTNKYQENLNNNISYNNGTWTSYKQLCYMNKRIIVGLESNGLLCNDYKDNILFTDYQLIKKLIQYQEIKRYVLYSGFKLTKAKRIDKIFKLLDKRSNNDSNLNDNEIIDNNSISVIFNPEDIINIKKEVADFINYNNMGIHLKNFDPSSVQMLKNSLLWSWDIDTNFIESSIDSCIIINKETGRWNYDSCNENFPLACQNKNNPLIWTISLNNDECEIGYNSVLPRSPEENHMLYKILQNKTLSSYNNFYLSKEPLNDYELNPNRRDEIIINGKIEDKNMIVPSYLSPSEIFDEVLKTTLTPILFVILIGIFLIGKMIYKQYFIFKRRRRRLDVKKRLKNIETKTVPI